VIVPALIYFAFNRGTPAERGWGIPMATDIAFALGVLALLGDRVPIALKVFVTALAIVDDIMGVLVIALFYTEKIAFVSLGIGLAGVALSFVANKIGVRKPAVYAFIGVIVWFAMLKSGVHATIAGVLLAFTIPVNTFIAASSSWGRAVPCSIASRPRAPVPPMSTTRSMHSRCNVSWCSRRCTASNTACSLG
jgi:NhaA family Na+:H+ antiporter